MESQKETILQLLNEKSYLPIKKLVELNIGEAYTITNIYKINSKYGERLIVSLNKSFQVYLPAKYATRIKDVDFFRENNVNMIYYGLKDSDNGFKYHDILFE